MNDILFLHWRYRELEAEEARKQMERERRARITRRVLCCAYWGGIAFGACALIYDISKGAW